MSKTLVESVPGAIRQEVCKAVNIQGFGSVDRSRLRPASPQERDLVAKSAEQQANACFDSIFSPYLVPLEVQKSAPTDQEGNPANACLDGLFAALFTGGEQQ